MSQRTVLLIENDQDCRLIYGTYLRHSGYRVLEAADAPTGLEVAGAERPDIILMDIEMPVIDGWEATRRLKRDPETSSIPVVAITAHAFLADRMMAVEAGCDGYLSKPAKPKQVLFEVQRVLGGRSTMLDGVLFVGRLTSVANAELSSR